MTGQNIVVAHYPPRISLHSLQNGREEHSLPIQSPTGPASSPPRITGVWWFKKETKADKKDMPDIFKRGNVIVSDPDTFNIGHKAQLKMMLPARFRAFYNQNPATTRCPTGRYYSLEVSFRMEGPT